jgi:hypothetical protein
VPSALTLDTAPLSGAFGLEIALLGPADRVSSVEHKLVLDDHALIPQRVL